MKRSQSAIGSICDFPHVLRQLEKCILRNQTKENCCFFEHLLSRIALQEALLAVKYRRSCPYVRS
ncbi:MAG: hypothetical protein Q7J38_05840, partial [Gallionella sp.]|nr:hypothetical protein [Gallionella sp.]